MTIQENEKPKNEDQSDSIPEVSLPKTVRLKAFRTMKQGQVIKSSIDGITFWARVPKGGVKQFEEFESPYPTFVKVQAPQDLSSGEWFSATHSDGTQFKAIVPEEGCSEGDFFETLHPSVAPPSKGKLVTSSSGSSMFEGGDRNCTLCAIFAPLLCVAVVALIFFFIFGF